MFTRFVTCFILVSVLHCNAKKKDDDSGRNLLLALAVANSQTPPSIDPTSINATEITLNSSTATSGTISSSEVYYKVTLVSGKASLFGVFGLSSSLDLQITAYDTSGKYVGAINKNTAGSLEQISIANTASGTYYFKVSRLNGSGTFLSQVFNGPVRGNGLCDLVSSCIDNASGSLFTSSNCSGGTYVSATSASSNTCAARMAIFGTTIVGKCTTFSNNGAQTLNRASGYGSFSASDCSSAVKGEAYLFE